MKPAWLTSFALGLLLSLGPLALAAENPAAGQGTSTGPAEATQTKGTPRLAEEADPSPSPPPSQEEEFQELLAAIKLAEQNCAALNRQLKKTADPAAAQQLQTQRETLERHWRDLKLSF